MKTEKQLNLEFLKDSPILKSEPEYYNFYHDYISPTLNKITAKKGIHTIGLFGFWGSGKSTIIDNLKADYKDFPLFLFDAWKYQGDPLRRTFLISLFNFINKEKLWKEGQEPPENFLDDLYEDSSESEAMPVVENAPVPFWKKILGPIWRRIKKHPFIYLIFGSLLITLISWVVGQYFLGESHPYIASLLIIPGIVGLSTTATAAIAIVSKQILEAMTKLLMDDLRVDIKTQTRIKHREYLNSPEQFEKKFIEIIQRVKQKTVIVFDNIDRVQGDTAIEILSAIKTFIEPRKDSNIIFIIPCDSDAIMEQLKKYYGDSGVGVDLSEYLRKLFNIIIWTPDFIPTDLEDFTTKQLAQLNDEEELFQNNDDLLRVITQAFKSPREIKQFINNLVASVLIVSNTDVWSEVKQNISYLAKVLVLRQKYPKAYNRLKDKWYQPENILTEDDPQSLRDFMVATSRVQVTNAEPYIYFKLSNTEKNFSDSKELLPALASEDIEKSKLLISKHSKDPDALISFILGLYGKYQNQQDWLTRIVRTFLIAISDLEFEITKIRFFNSTAEVMEKYIWVSYRLFNTDRIFQYFISNTKVDKYLRNNLLQRYVTALGSTEIVEEKDASTAKEIIRNLLAVKDIPSEQLLQTRSAIETHYINLPGVVNIFPDLKTQKRFVTKNALEKYIQDINQDNFLNLLPTVLPYKEYVKELGSNNILVQVLNSLVNQERVQNSDHTTEKQNLYENILKLSDFPYSLLPNSDTQLLANLETETIENYKNITSTDNKIYLVPVLYKVSIYLSETHPEIEKDADSVIEDFINNSSAEILDDLLSRFSGKQPSEFVDFYTVAFEQRAIKNGAGEIESGYNLMKVENKQRIINSIIDNREDLGLTYIKSLEELPNRIETLQKLLSRAPGLPPSQRREEAYEYITSLIKESDEVSIRETAIKQMEDLLKTDNTSDQETGFHFLTSANFMNDTQKRVLGDSLIEWLRTPGKIVNSGHRSTLKAVTKIFNQLHPTRQNDLMFILFDLLTREEDRSTNEVGIEIISEIKPQWKIYQNYFEDFKEKVQNWSNLENQSFVFTEVLTRLRPGKATKKESAYWESLEQQVKKEENP